MNYTRKQLEFQRDLFSNMDALVTTITVASLVAFLNDMLTLYEERDALAVELTRTIVNSIR